MTGFTRLALSLLTLTSLAAAAAIAEVPSVDLHPRDSVDPGVSNELIPKRHVHRQAAELSRRAAKKKVGLAWNMGDDTNYQKQFYSPTVSWCYSWSAWSCSNTLEFVPMMWGNRDNAIRGWKSQVMGKHWKHIRGFNEPDHPGQAGLSVSAAVKLWWKYVEPVNADRVGAPAVTNSDRGRKWLKDFLKACKGCKIDFVPLHYYGTSVQGFKDTVNKVKAIAGDRPVWVTEWACQNFGHPSDKCSLQEVKDFLRQTQGWMNSKDWVERYSWFGTLDGMGNVNPTNAMLKNHKINDLGRQYIS